jgi:hypothetical protein
MRLMAGVDLLIIAGGRMQCAYALPATSVNLAWPNAHGANDQVTSLNVCYVEFICKGF